MRCGSGGIFDTRNADFDNSRPDQSALRKSVIEVLLKETCTMTENEKTEPSFPWWYAPASAAITGGAVAIPALGFPMNVVAAIVVAVGSGLYLGYHQRRTDLPQGIGQGRRRTVGLAFIALFLVLMVLSVVVSFAELPRVVAATLVFAGCAIGFFYPGGWRAAG